MKKENNLDKTNINNMPSFYETVARMKGLYTYGKEINEDNNLKSSTLEYHAIAADGNSYGIVRECNKYYIKKAPKSKEMLSEAYDYIGGFCNKKNYEYTSYANAMKNFEQKMASINEACEGNVNISTLDPFKSDSMIVEGTQKMQNEIARCRQIMYNTAMIMNESDFKPVAGGKANNANQPEAENGKTGAEGWNKTSAKPEYAGSKTSRIKKASPFDTDAKLSEGKCCEKCGKNPCECSCCNEEAGDIGDAPLMPNTENWGTEGIGKGKDPKQVGWEMDGQQKVNEEENDWGSKGLPASPGVGEADTDHNNDPFNKSINEADENDDTEEVEDSESEENTEDGNDYDLTGDDEFDNNDNSEEPTEDFNVDDDTEGSDDEFDDGLGDDEDFENTDDFNGEEEFNSDDFESDDEDLRSEIESLKAEIESLKAQINGENEGFESDDLEDTEDFGNDEFGGDEFSGEGEDFGGDEFGSDEFGDEGDDFGGDEFGGEGDEFSDEGNEFSDEGDEFGGDEFGDEGEDDSTDDYQNTLKEQSVKRINRIVESVVKKVLKEDELHVFGKHPGYRKKPMELPTTGEDKNKWGEDWNDESVHSEEPFGSKIGDGDPFNNLVNAVTKDVMYQLKKGIPIEGMNKKKVN